MAQANRKNSRLLKNQRKLPKPSGTTPRETETNSDMITKLVPINKGPKVMAVQYNNMLCAKGRRLRTRQMALRVRSIVKTNANADSNNAVTPTTPNRLALLANKVR